MAHDRPISLTNKLCAAALGCLGFGLSLIIGLYVDNPFETVILRAVAVLAVFAVLGYVLASLGSKAVQENFDNAMEIAELEAQAQAQAQAQTQPQTPEQPDRTPAAPTHAPDNQSTPTREPPTPPPQPAAPPVAAAPG